MTLSTILCECGHEIGVHMRSRSDRGGKGCGSCLECRDFREVFRETITHDSDGNEFITRQSNKRYSLNPDEGVSGDPK